MKQLFAEPYARQIDRGEMLRSTSSHYVLEENLSLIYLLNEYNDLDKLYRIVAYVLRWSNLKKLKETENWFYSASAMKEATSAWIKILQQPIRNHLLHSIVGGGVKI